MIRLETKMDFILQSAIWDRLLNLPVPFFRKYTSGELALKTNSILVLRKVLSDSVFYALVSSITLVFNLIYLFWFNFTMGLVTLTILCVSIFLVAIIGNKMKSLQSVQIDLQNKLYGIINQLLTSISKIKTSGSEINAFKQWSDRFGEQKRQNMALRNLSVLIQQILTLTPVIVTIFIFLFIHLYTTQKMSTGEFMTFFTAVTIINRAGHGIRVRKALASLALTPSLRSHTFKE